MLKTLVRGSIVGITVFFVAIAVRHHWQSVREISLDGRGIALLVVALIFTFCAHLWAALVWFWILKTIGLDLNPKSTFKLYLTTNIAKYIPGNIGHFSGRVLALKKEGRSLRLASLGTLLEPLLMAAAAAIVALLSRSSGWIRADSSNSSFVAEIAGLAMVLIAVHPLVLNPLLRLAGKLKKQPEGDNLILLSDYPLIPLLGECGFILLRGAGFIVTWLAFAAATPSQCLTLLGAFSTAWLLGLVIPGAPGGLGVFEATAIALLPAATFPVGISIPTLAVFRLASIGAEAIAAGWAWRWRSD